MSKPNKSVIYLLTVLMIGCLSVSIPLGAEEKDGHAADASGATPAGPGTTTTSSKPTADELSLLKEQLAAQQKQIEQLRQTLEKQSKLLEKVLPASPPAQTNQSAQAGSGQSQGATQVASATPVIPSSVKAKETLEVLPTSPSNGAALVGAAPAAEDNPSAIHFKGINITPVGFMAAETVWRDHALSADVNTPFNSVPMPGASQSQIGEFNAGGRQSRFGSLFEGKIDHAKIGGYYEADFLSGGTTSNSNQSNSYTLRQRQFWGQAAMDNGWTVTGGQMWSLLTETKKGADNRSEALPMTIDAQYTVGFSWARQYGLRITKNFDNKFWLGFSLEEPQDTITVSGANANWLAGAPGTGGGLDNPVANYSYNRGPDFIFKAIAQPKWGHFELFGVVSMFHDRVFPCETTAAGGMCGGVTGPSAATAFNDSRTGGGIGANARVTLAKHVDVGFHLFGGDGIGRYGTGGLPVSTIRPDGTIAPLRNLQTLGTLEYHGNKVDLYSNFGGEFSSRGAYTIGTKGEGYGSPLFSDAGCSTEIIPGAAVSTPTSVGGSAGFVPGSLANCSAQTRDLLELSLGFWYRFYKGPKGTVQWGPQYSYVIRNAWSGVGATTGSSVSPQGTENMFFTSFRYYLP